MARNSIDYSKQIEDINAPVKGAAGELRERSNALSGTATAIGIQANTQLGSFLGNTAVEAAKGYMEHKVGQEVQSTLDQTEGIGDANQPSVQEQAQGESDRISAVADFMGVKSSSAPEVMMMRASAEKVLTAENQGMLTREEALTRMAATVKKYSALMPGWAGEFRKVAAELTGINAIDVYQTHAALTQKNARELRADAMAKADAEYTKDVAKYSGIAPSQVTEQHRQIYFNKTQDENALKNFKNMLERGNLQQDEADKVFELAVLKEAGGAMASLSAKLATLGALGADQTRFRDSQEFGAKLATEIELIRGSLVDKISRDYPGGSAAARKRQIDMINTWADNWAKGVNTVDGRNAFLSIVKEAKANSDLLMDRFSNANPALAVLNRFGFSTPLGQVYFSNGKEQFERNFPAFKGLFDNLTVQGVTQWQNAMTGYMSGNPNAPSPAEVAKVDPGLAKIVCADLLQCAKEWSTKTNLPRNQQEAWAQSLGKLSSSVFNFGLDNDINEAHKMFASKDTKRQLAELSETQRTIAVAPMLTRVNEAVNTFTGQFSDAIKAYNEDQTSAPTRAGWRLSVVVDPITGDIKTTNTLTGASTLSPLAQQMGAPKGKALEGQDAGAGRKRLDQLVARVNKLTDTYYNGAVALGAEVGSKLEFKQRVSAAMLEGKPVVLNESIQKKVIGEDLQGALKNKQVERAAEGDRILGSIIAAERSDVNRGTSPAGARGLYQFMEATAKDYGLKVDLKSGIDERDDDAKAGKAAAAYMRDLLKVFDGDVAKAAAGYNAGQKNVVEAIKKAKDAGAPNQWINFLPKPSETGPYVERFLARYNRQP